MKRVRVLVHKKIVLQNYKNYRKISFKRIL